MAMSFMLFLCMSAHALVSAWPAGTAPAPYALEDAELHFENFIQMYERTYADESEKQARFQIFKKNLEKINSLNENSDHAVFDITQFSDVSRDEFASKINCLDSFRDSRPQKIYCTYLHDEDITYNDALESFDWRDYGVVTPVKEQKMCGSSYAFSATGNIEGQFAIKHKELIRLSEQQIVDCDKINGGCIGGRMDIAFKTLIYQGGIQSEADYPYQERRIFCRFYKEKVKVKLDGCRSFNLTSQEKVKQLLYHTGPIAIGIKGGGLYVYSKGILTDKECDVNDINHLVLLVGYGSEGDKPFWIVKNSWGTKFGEGGYFRMQRGEGALSCSMLNHYMATAIVA